MSGTRLLRSLFVLLSVTPAAFSVVGHEPVQASAGEDVVLSCLLNPPTDMSKLTVEWKLNDLNVHVYRHKKDDDDLQDEQFRGRTSLFHEELSRGNISLKLTNVRVEDSGVYSCYVPKLESPVKRGNVNLTVRGNDETEDDQKQSRDQTGAIVGGAVGAVIVIILVLVLGWKYEDTLKTCWDERWRTEKKNLENQ